MTQESGFKQYVYLYHKTLQLDNVGLISTNMVELLAKGITELSYREYAEKVSEMTEQTISAIRVWNVIQEWGKKVCEEAELVEKYKKGHMQGEKEILVLFEEANGVYVNLQGKDGKEATEEGTL